MWKSRAPAKSPSLPAEAKASAGSIPRQPRYGGDAFGSAGKCSGRALSQSSTACDRRAQPFMGQLEESCASRTCFPQLRPLAMASEGQRSAWTRLGRSFIGVSMRSDGYPGPQPAHVQLFVSRSLDQLRLTSSVACGGDRGDVAAATVDADAVRIAIVADTEGAYIDAAATAERLAVTQQTVGLLDQSVRLVGGRVEAVRLKRLDLLRITALRDQRAALLPGPKLSARRRCSASPRSPAARRATCRRLPPRPVRRRASPSRFRATTGPRCWPAA